MGAPTSPALCHLYVRALELAVWLCAPDPLPPLSARYADDSLHVGLRDSIERVICMLNHSRVGVLPSSVPPNFVFPSPTLPVPHVLQTANLLASAPPVRFLTRHDSHLLVQL